MGDVFDEIRDSPSISSKIRQLSCQWQDLDFGSKGHLKVGIEFTMSYKS